jgi:pSer/pThr/pTyr-binding forkhead associated (FHA) protein
VRQTVDSEDVPQGVTEIVSRPTFDPGASFDGDQLDPPPILAWLVVKEPRDRRGTMVQVQANQSIGREGDIRWNDPGLSRQHARLTLEPPEEDPGGFPVFHLWPFGPTNPVYINGRQIRGATPLHENDEIRLGDTLFVFKLLTD